MSHVEPGNPPVESSLRQRIVTASLLAPAVVAAVLLLPTTLFGGGMAVIVGLGAWEWSRLARLSSDNCRWLFTLLVMLSLIPVWFLMQYEEGAVLLLLPTLVWWSLAAVWVARYPASASKWSRSAGRRIAIGFMILVPAWGALIALHRHGEQGPWLILLLMLLIWGADSGAYFAGRKWGRDKLAPQVSPGKSWQGLWGGMAVALSLAVLLTALFPIHVKYQIYFIVICNITVIFSVLGDLVESMFKRDAGVKDSGSLLPGHGGVLDRIDSITAAAPVFALGTLGVCL